MAIRQLGENRDWVLDRAPYPRAVTLGERLRRLREERGLTQGDLARGICGRTYVSQIEQDKRFPTPRTLSGLARRLGVSLGSLAGLYLASPMAGLGQCLGLARELAREGDVAAAEQAFRRAVERFKRDTGQAAQSADLLETLAVIRARQGRREQAEALTERALKHRLRSPSRRFPLAGTYYRLGTLRLQRQDWEGAMDALLHAFNLILPIDPRTAAERTAAVTALHEQVVQALADLFVQARDFGTARLLYRWAAAVWRDYGILERPSPELRLGRALAEMGVNAFENAERLLRDLLDDQGSTPDEILVHVHTNLGVLARLRGDWQGARRHQLAAWRLHRRTGRGDARAICNELARCALQAGRHDGARVWLRRAAAARDAGSPVLMAETRLLAARAEAAAGRLEDAEALLDQAEPQAVDAGAVQQLIGIERVCLALLRGDHDGALRGLDALRGRMERALL